MYMLWIMAVVAFMPLCSTQTMEDSTNLYDKLMTGYRKNLRPALNQSAPTIVQIEFDLLSIREVDAIVGKLSIIGIVYIRWFDPRMMWNPYLYNKTFTLNIPQEEVWKPDLIVGYAVDTVKAIGYDHKWVNVRYIYNGTAKYAPADILNAACDIDVAFYPYDTQNCLIYFLPWGMLSNEIEFYAPRINVYKRYFTKHGEWALEEATTRTELMYDLYPALVLEISIRRRSTFVIVNVILPIMFMGIINILVFVLPAKSGERVSFAITVLLAIAVFLTLVVENLPKTSMPMSTVCYFLLTNLVLSSLIMVGTIFNLMLYHRKEDKPKPKWLLWLASLMMKKQQSKCKAKALNSTKCKNSIEVIDLSDETPRKHVTGPVPKSTRTLERQMSWDTESDDVITETSATWKDVSKAVDRICIILSLVWLCGSVVSFFVMVSTQKVPTVG